MRLAALPGTLVVDASVGVKWVVDEAGSDLATALIPGRLLVIPALFWVEAANVLATKARRGELSAEAAADAWRDLALAPLETVPLEPAALEPALGLALDLRHPVYDCCYLALARARRTVLVTADRRFGRLAAGHAAHAGTVVSLHDLSP